MAFPNSASARRHWYHQRCSSSVLSQSVTYCFSAITANVAQEGAFWLGVMESSQASIKCLEPGIIWMNKDTNLETHRLLCCCTGRLRASVIRSQMLVHILIALESLGELNNFVLYLYLELLLQEVISSPVATMPGWVWEPQVSSTLSFYGGGNPQREEVDS